MSRIKIILLILIIAALGIVFVQNRELIALKLLCADRSQSCFYQTPQLPLAVWIGLFTFLGAIANLLIQILNRYGSRNSNRQKPPLDDDLYPNQRSMRNKSRDKYTVSPIDSEDFNVENKFADATSYEAKQEPQNVERSGSTYSYKYREAGDRVPSDRANDEKTIIEPDVIADRSKDNDDEDWI